jgi:hypothetical protein
MVDIKEYIKFTLSLTEMDEVKENRFPLPKEITFSLDDINHAALQTQIHDSKGLNKEEFKHEDEFVVSIYGIDLKFIKNETVSK